MWNQFDPTIPDYFLVIDLEATCSNDGSIAREEMEIIEIGAVMFSRSKMAVVEEFGTLIKPTRNPILSDFCKELTTITQNKVCEAPEFKEAFGQFTEWYNTFDPKNNKILFSSWGNYDKNQLLRDCAFHGVKYPFAKHLNIKKYFSFVHNRRKQVGTTKALRSIGLEFEGTHHRGIDDARNITRLLDDTIKRDLLD